jgi:Icc protein
MLIAQISDLHFLPKGTLAFGRIDVAGCLERAVDHLNALEPAADAVLITGDLTNDGDDAVWAELMGALGRLEAPIYPLPVG